MKRVTLFLFLICFICTGCSQALSKESGDTNQLTTPETLETLSTEEEKTKVKTVETDIGTPEKPIEITEKLFLLQINDVFYNFEDYEGKTLKVEGMYGFDIIEGKEYHVVYRLGPGCCENDDWGGFFLNYDGEWPEFNEWIEVQGTPRIVKEGSLKWLYLDVTSLIVKEERGSEFVYQ